MNTYIKHRKNKKKPDISGAKWVPVKKVFRGKRSTQLDRIERKLDDLLSRPPVQILPPSPGTWNVPETRNPVYEKAPWWMNPDVPPPTLTCTCNAGKGETK